VAAAVWLVVKEQANVSQVLRQVHLAGLKWVQQFCLDGELQLGLVLEHSADYSVDPKVT
jgi:hypothetical protein